MRKDPIRERRILQSILDVLKPKETVMNDDILPHPSRPTQQSPVKKHPEFLIMAQCWDLLSTLDDYDTTRRCLCWLMDKLEAEHERDREAPYGDH